MRNIAEIFYNRILWGAVTSWFIAQVLKVLIYWGIEKHFDWRRFFGAGGMPSSHAASVVSLAVLVGGLEGFNSTYFAIAFIFMTVVLHDARGVRREAGAQAKIINRILRNIIIDGKPATDAELKELVGHTPLEVLVGSIIGMIVGVLYLF